MSLCAVKMCLTHEQRREAQSAPPGIIWSSWKQRWDASVSLCIWSRVHLLGPRSDTVNCAAGWAEKLCKKTVIILKRARILIKNLPTYLACKIEMPECVCLQLETLSGCLILSVLYWPCQRDAEWTGDRQPVGSFGFSWVLIFISLSYFNAQHILFISRAISILRCHSDTAELTASFHCFLSQCFQHVRVSVLNMSVLLYLALTEVLK